ncbi:MAG: restriction endonuclease subunit S [Verrucomicrobiae bacterium]|nr:restriction endonuclease subunit S [Verrucomicrobiae bacterium]
MRPNHRRVSIDSLCRTVTSGGTPSRSESRYWENGTIPWFKTGELREWYLGEAEEMISEEGLANSAAKLFPPNTVLMAMYGDGRTITSLGILRDEAATNQACCAFIADPIKCHYLYLFYALKYHRHELLKLVVAGAQRNLSNGIIRNFRVIERPLKAQESIAAILSAYDEAMENNRRRMGLLEKAARLLYEEWFVRFRFPGHEHTPISHGLPQGWERKPLRALCDSIDYGYTASAQVEEIGPKFLRITDIVPDFIDWPAVPHCPIEDDRLNKFRLREGDIVIARTGATVGYAKRLHKRHPEAVFASYLVRLRVKRDVDNLMVGVFVESDDYKSYVQSRIGGAAQPNANARVLSGAEILVPPPRIQRDFHETVEPVIDQREILQLQNQKLRATRDLLLPRLMSGEVEVS